MADFYLYLSALFVHWWPLVSTGSLLGIEEFCERYWKWARQKIVKIPLEWRQRIKVGALIAAVFWSGFLAWSEEHETRVKAEKSFSNMHHLGRYLAYDNISLS